MSCPTPNHWEEREESSVQGGLTPDQLLRTDPPLSTVPMTSLSKRRMVCVEKSKKSSNGLVSHQSFKYWEGGKEGSVVHQDW